MKFTGPFEERDWKYLSSLREEFVETFCRRANLELIEILQRSDISENERRLEARRVAKDRDSEFRDLFGDWRRSTMEAQVLFFRRYGLLTDTQMLQLSPKASEYVRQHFGAEQ